MDWVNTLPGVEVAGKGYCYPVTQYNSNDSETLEFGNYNPGTIRGRKFEDINGDGSRQPDGEDATPGTPDDEILIQGWMMELQDDQGNPIVPPGGEDNPQLTNANGLATWTKLVPGRTYILCEEERLGWGISKPANGNNCRTIDLTNGQTETRLFGNYEGIKIIVYKYEDVNGNQAYEVGEPILPGWDMTLKGTENGTGDTVGPDTQQTAGDPAMVMWEGLRPGDYKVSETLQPDWVQTKSKSLNFKGSTSGEVLEGYIGNYRPATRIARKTEDLNGDGIKDAGEPWLENWEMSLDGATGVFAADPLAGDDYQVQFTDLRPGDYEVCETLKGGWVNTDPADASKCKKVTVVSGETAEVLLGNFKKTTITAIKFHDKNADTVMDATDPFLEWSMTLTGGATKTTDPVTGEAKWTGLGPGTYEVCEDLAANRTGSTRRLCRPPLH